MALSIPETYGAQQSTLVIAACLVNSKSLTERKKVFGLEVKILRVLLNRQARFFTVIERLLQRFDNGHPQRIFRHHGLSIGAAKEMGEISAPGGPDKALAVDQRIDENSVGARADSSNPARKGSRRMAEINNSVRRHAERFRDALSKVHKIIDDIVLCGATEKTDVKAFIKKERRIGNAHEVDANIIKPGTPHEVRGLGLAPIGHWLDGDIKPIGLNLPLQYRGKMHIAMSVFEWVIGRALLE